MEEHIESEFFKVPKISNHNFNLSRNCKTIYLTLFTQRKQKLDKNMY